jgi:hypothetical protein
MWSASGPKPVREPEEFFLVDGIEHHDRSALDDRARALAGPKEDWKLRELVEILRGLLGEGYRPSRHTTHEVDA